MTLAANVPIYAQGNSPVQLRQYIGQQVGSIDKLQVPDEAHLPQPRLPDGTLTADPRYATTEAKRFLGKLLFHDPVRTTRIDPSFGGVPATAQTGSCGSCHSAVAGSKAGQTFNFNVGGEGKGYTDAQGNFIVRRRPRVDILPRLRQSPLFPGDVLVDALPTLTDVNLLPPAPGHIEVDTPARGHKSPAPLALLATGRLDALDSVGRQSPSLFGAAFANRLLLGGFAGEPNSSAGALNPNGDQSHGGDPAAENLTLLLLDAHRMLSDTDEAGNPRGESLTLQKIPAFVKLFRDAFPTEAAQADAANNINLLISDDTVLRATATYMRAAVTRNTPFDKFLAGDNSALTEGQRRGAELFFTPATGGAGGAGCFSCHSGPMLDKQYNDPDVTGVGRSVETNFINVGIGDHPIQALNRLARNDPNHHDPGRQEITGQDDAFYKFRVLTMRQLKDARTFFHNGSFTTVADVVAYFNAGVPQDPTAGAAPTLETRFTHPRGPGSAPGLGLSPAQMADITDFLENGLYDPAFVIFDPKSTTRSFQPDVQDLTYSIYRPDLANLGAIDGLMPSGLPIDNNDPLSRRDDGLEFLDVTQQLSVTGGSPDKQQTINITNSSSSIVDTHLLVIVRGLPPQVTLNNSSGTTKSGDPYIRVFLPDGVLQPSQSIPVSLAFKATGNTPVSYTLEFLSGQGKP
jgi:hypothetical protein